MVKIWDLLVTPFKSYRSNTDNKCNRVPFFRKNTVLSVFLTFLSNGLSVWDAVGLKRKRNEWSTKSYIGSHPFHRFLRPENPSNTELGLWQKRYFSDIPRIVLSGPSAPRKWGVIVKAHEKLRRLVLEYPLKILGNGFPMGHWKVHRSPNIPYFRAIELYCYLKQGALFLST